MNKSKKNYFSKRKKKHSKPYAFYDSTSVKLSRKIPKKIRDFPYELKDSSRYRKNFDSCFGFKMKYSELSLTKSFFGSNEVISFAENNRITLTKFLIQNGIELLLPMKYNINFRKKKNPVKLHEEGSEHMTSKKKRIKVISVSIKKKIGYGIKEQKAFLKIFQKNLIRFL